MRNSHAPRISQYAITCVLIPLAILAPSRVIGGIIAFLLLAVLYWQHKKMCHELAIAHDTLDRFADAIEDVLHTPTSSSSSSR